MNLGDCTGDIVSYASGVKTPSGRKWAGALYGSNPYLYYCDEGSKNWTRVSSHGYYPYQSICSRADGRIYFSNGDDVWVRFLNGTVVRIFVKTVGYIWQVIVDSNDNVWISVQNGPILRVPAGSETPVIVKSQYDNHQGIVCVPSTGDVFVNISYAATLRFPGGGISYENDTTSYNGSYLASLQIENRYNLLSPYDGKIYYIPTSGGVFRRNADGSGVQDLNLGTVRYGFLAFDNIGNFYVGPGPSTNSNIKVSEFSFTYNANGATGGAVPVDAATRSAGLQATVLGNTGSLVKSGFRFVGWNTAADGSGIRYTAGSTFTVVPADTVLYAEWVPLFTANYHGNGNTSGEAPVDPMEYAAGEDVTVLDSGTLERDGFIQDGWNTAEDGSGTARAVGSTFSMGDADVDLYAVWVPVYTVTYDRNRATSGTVPIDPGVYFAGDRAAVLGNTGILARSGFKFIGWIDGNGNRYSLGDEIDIVGNVTLYALWEQSIFPTIRVDKSQNDAVIDCTDLHGVVFYTGYELQRKSDTEDWQNWNGTSWGGAAAVLPSNRFTDYSLSSGIYKYRVRAQYQSDSVYYSDWVESSWVRFASASAAAIGWTLGNYSVPEGEFGEILTADDLRRTYLWGVPFTSTTGTQYTDDQIRAMIASTVAEFEHVLNLTIQKRVIKCADDLPGDAAYDETEDAYYYHRMNWNAGGRLNTKRRPIISVERFELYTITMGRIMDLMGWLRIDHKKGVLHFYPRMDQARGTTMSTYPPFLTQGYLRNQSYSNAYRVDYTAGFEDASKVPWDLRDIIGKAAACRLLNIIGDGLIAGFANMSLSLDGISESFGTTASATNAMYGARINQYLKEIETWLKANRHKFGSFVMGCI